MSDIPKRNGLSHREAALLSRENAKAACLRLKQERMDLYDLNPKKCGQCEKALSYDKRWNKFCNQSCAASYNNPRKPLRANRVRYSSCLFCSKELNRTQFMYCSQKCWVEFTRKQKLDLVLSTQSFENIYEDPTAQKKALLYMRGHKCEICGLTEWQNQPAPLVMDHINGNSEDNSLINLRLLCANCNMQTDTFCARNKKGNGRWKRRQRYQEGKSY